MRDLMELKIPSTEAPGKPPKRQKLLETLLSEFWANIGDKVYFKNAPRSKRVSWTVIEIEKDYQKCKWTKKSGRPNFVRLQRDNKPNQIVWTCSDQLQPAGFK